MKNHLQRIGKMASGWLPDGLMLTGAASVSVGIGMAYVPAGWIAAGVFLLAGGVLLSRGVK